jgi:hypothetical protein
MKQTTQVSRMTNRVVAQLWGRSEWTASTIIAWVVFGPNPVVILDFQMTGLGNKEPSRFLISLTAAS